jgi:hypothetical protein
MATINSSLNDALVAQAALEQFTAELLGLNVFTTSYSSEVARRGASVSIPLVANLTATTFADDYTSDNGTLNAVTVTLDKHKIVTVGLSDTDYSKSSAADVVKFANQQGKALAQAVIQDVFSAFVTTASSAAQFAASVTGASAFTITNARTLRKALTDDKAPLTDRSLILNSSLYDSLLSQSGLLDASQFGARDTIVEGRVPRVLGMNVYESIVLPTNSITLSGMAVHPNAMAIAVRAVESQAPGEYLAAQTITDPTTGLSISYRRFYMPNTGKHYVSFSSLYGYSRAITAAAKLVLGA